MSISNTVARVYDTIRHMPMKLRIQAITLMVFVSCNTIYLFNSFIFSTFWRILNANIVLLCIGIT